jgi:hypothetical protein
MWAARADRYPVGSSFRSSRRPQASPFGPSLPRLANDGEVLGAGPPPRFPHSLLLADVKLGEAVEAGDAVRIEAARQRLADGVRALIASDLERIDGLADTPEHADERGFLRDRLHVLELRLSGLEGLERLERLEAPARPPARPPAVARIPVTGSRPAASGETAIPTPGPDGPSAAIA